MSLYVGQDISQGSPIITSQIPFTARSTAISADGLRQVEIRFGENGKAYRYLNGLYGTALTRRKTFVYAEAVTESDTIGRGSVGKLGEGYVDVPFTTWINDSILNEKQQLAVGFIETASKTFLGNPTAYGTPVIL